jgi:hypothetical protein
VKLLKPPLKFMPQVGGTFLQAESEVAAINMVYGAASAGKARDDRVFRAWLELDAGGHFVLRRL